MCFRNNIPNIHQPRDPSVKQFTIPLYSLTCQFFHIEPMEKATSRVPVYSLNGMVNLLSPRITMQLRRCPQTSFTVSVHLAYNVFLELKSTSDDAIGPYLTSLPAPYTFTADNTKSNIRLCLGYVAVSIAAVSFYVDYAKGWEATKQWILPAVIAYFILNVALTMWIWTVEAGQVFEGTRHSGERVRLRQSSRYLHELILFRSYVSVLRRRSTLLYTPSLFYILHRPGKSYERTPLQRRSRDGFLEMACSGANHLDSGLQKRLAFLDKKHCPRNDGERSRKTRGCRYLRETFLSGLYFDEILLISLCFAKA